MLPWPASERGPARAGVGRLSELGLEAYDLDAVVEVAERRPELATTPGSPDREDLERLLEHAL
jgi:alcohol dehydrogenase class IV